MIGCQQLDKSPHFIRWPILGNHGRYAFEYKLKLSDTQRETPPRGELLGERKLIDR